MHLHAHIENQYYKFCSVDSYVSGLIDPIVWAILHILCILVVTSKHLVTNGFLGCKDWHAVTFMVSSKDLKHNFLLTTFLQSAALDYCTENTLWTPCLSYYYIKELVDSIVGSVDGQNCKMMWGKNLKEEIRSVDGAQLRDKFGVRPSCA